MPNIFRKYNILETEVDKILANANHIMDMELALDELIKQSETGSIKIKPGTFVDRRVGSHKANRHFANQTNIKKLPDAISIVKQLKTKDFCHYEIDGKYPNDKLYCFKLIKNEIDNMDDIEFEDDILIKFKFRPDETEPSSLYLMSLHYPDHSKESWTYLFRQY